MWHLLQIKLENFTEEAWRTMADFKELAALCRGKTVYIQTHNFPDPDAIGSAFGLQELLAHFEIPAKICYDGRIDKLSTAKMLDTFRIELFSKNELRGRLRDTDYIICVDSQKNGGNMTDFTGEEIASIDHHPTYVPVSYLYSDIRMVGACATLIAGYFRELGITPSRDAATAMLYGIKMDTLQFTRGVTEEDVRAFAYLLPLIDQKTMTRLEMNQVEFQDLKVYAAAIEHIRVFGYVGFSYIPFSCPDAMIAILSDFILSLIEVEVAIVYCKREDGFKLSVRSERDDVDAGSLTRLALEGIGDGGGHATMAGGLIPLDKIPLLGNYPDSVLHDRFLKSLRHLLQAQPV